MPAAGRLGGRQAGRWQVAAATCQELYGADMTGRWQFINKMNVFQAQLHVKCPIFSSPAAGQSKTSYKTS